MILNKIRGRKSDSGLYISYLRLPSNSNDIIEISVTDQWMQIAYMLLMEQAKVNTTGKVSF